MREREREYKGRERKGGREGARRERENDGGRLIRETFLCPAHRFFCLLEFAAKVQICADILNNFLRTSYH